MKDNKANLSFVVLENNYSVNQGLATSAFFGVGVNLVLFLTRVMGQENADAANNVSKWTGMVYLFSLVGAFLSDSYWGRYKTCAIFQAILLHLIGILNFRSCFDSENFLFIQPKTHTNLLLHADLNYYKTHTQNFKCHLFIFNTRLQLRHGFFRFWIMV